MGVKLIKNGGNKMKLLRVDTIQEVQLKLDTYFSKMKRETERVTLRAACGRYLGEDVYSDTSVPSFRRSIVDGFAVRASDTFGVGESSPVFLQMVGTVQMGEASFFRVGPGETAYVPTGGMVPEGADAVVMVEHVDLLENATIGINKAAAPNLNLMNVGEDYAEGARFYEKGHRISVKDMGLLAACGKASLVVYKKPLITILSTGDELISPSEMPEACQVRDINSYAIAAMAEAAGAQIQEIEIVGDQYDIFRVCVADALKNSDLVLISGGSSAGNKDLTESVIDSLGSPGVVTHGLAIKPGKPTIVGVFKQPEKTKVVFGLPGHPMSAIIVYDVIVKPFLKKYYFENKEDSQSLMAVLSENLHAGEGRQTYQLVALEKMTGEEETENGGRQKAQVLKTAPCVWIAKPIRAKSGSISQLMKADGYVVMGADSEGLEGGRLVEVVLIGNGY